MQICRYVQFVHICMHTFYFLIYFNDYAMTVVPFPLPLFPSVLYTPSHPRSPPPQFMSMGRTYKFFGFYISYTILTLPLSIFYLSFMLLILRTFSTLSTPPTPLLITLYVISISVVLFLFQLFAQFAFVFVLGVVINNCEFVVILLFFL